MKKGHQNILRVSIDINDLQGKIIRVTYQGIIYRIKTLIQE